MKKPVNFFLLFLFAFSLDAQNTTVKWGEESEFEKRMKISSILSDKSGHFYIVKQSSKKNKSTFILEKFSSATVTVEKRNELPLPVINQKNTKFEDLLVIGNNTWLFISYYDVTALKQFLFVQKITTELIYEGDPFEIDRVENIPEREKQDFVIILSPDDKSVLINHNLPFERYNNEKFSYRVFDENMKPVWGKEIELPYKDQFLKISNQLMDNENNIYLLSSVSSERKKGES